MTVLIKIRSCFLEITTCQYYFSLFKRKDKLLACVYIPSADLLSVLSDIACTMGEWGSTGLEDQEGCVLVLVQPPVSHVSQDTLSRPSFPY